MTYPHHRNLRVLGLLALSAPLLLGAGRAAAEVRADFNGDGFEDLAIGVPFEGLPDGFSATRYHSLVVGRDSVPDCLEITAETEDGLVMGLCHRELPIHGVQFHPESIASEHGHALLKNFLDLAGTKTEAGVIGAVA